MDNYDKSVFLKQRLKPHWSECMRDKRENIGLAIFKSLRKNNKSTTAAKKRELRKKKPRTKYWSESANHALAFGGFIRSFTFEKPVNASCCLLCCVCGHRQNAQAPGRLNNSRKINHDLHHEIKPAMLLQFVSLSLSFFLSLNLSLSLSIFSVQFICCVQQEYSLEE